MPEASAAAAVGGPQRRHGDDYREHIGDHCTNIAEWVEFSVTGIHKDCRQVKYM